MVYWFEILFLHGATVIMFWVCGTRSVKLFLLILAQAPLPPVQWYSKYYAPSGGA